MNKFSTKNRIPVIILVFIISVFFPTIVTSGDISDRHHTPFGIYINLTEDFYRALNEEAQDTKTYSNQKSDEYLRQIAVSSKFMVESNLQILKQQEKIIQLLKDIKMTNNK